MVRENFSAAAYYGHITTVRAMLKEGINPDDCDSYGETALRMASGNGQSGVVRVLIDAGATVDLATRSGETALMRAANLDRRRIVHLLIQEGANPDFLSTVDQLKYKDHIIMAKTKAVEKKDPTKNLYTIVSDTIIVKHEGYLTGVGALKTIFNFNNRTVTLLVDKNPGTPQKFADNRSEVIAAHNHMIEQGKDVSPPLRTILRRKKSPPNSL